ncbi:MAG: sel1 repeat family protein [Deltaproteobacteria bacterium]|jgi:TPR repeat protein|nr:sel1 repeat family protein [Deltaproteobacteria bacterium]
MTITALLFLSLLLLLQGLRSQELLAYEEDFSEWEHFNQVPAPPPLSPRKGHQEFQGAQAVTKGIQFGKEVLEKDEPSTEELEKLPAILKHAADVTHSEDAMGNICFIMAQFLREKKLSQIDPMEKRYGDMVSLIAKLETKSANFGHKGAANNLGIRYYMGHGVKQDLKKAKELFKTAAEAEKVPEALFNLYVLDHDNLKTEPGPLYLLSAAIERGSVYAEFLYNMNKLHAMFETLSGLFPERDFKIFETMGFFWDANFLERFRDLGPAFHQNSRFLLSRLERPRDIKIKGEIEGAFGEFYSLGLDAEVDMEKAQAWLSAAGAHGHMESQFKLGMWYNSGKHVKKNARAEQKWMKLASEQGNLTAQFFLGMNYYRLSLGADEAQDPQKGSEYLELALHELREAAKNGESNAMFILGRLYAQSESKIYDAKKAVKYLKDAASRGHVEALFNLGQHYLEQAEDFDGINKAVECFRDAAEMNHSQAQFFVSKLYLLGMGLTKDLDNSLYWLKRAAENGNNEARLILAQSYQNGSFTPVDMDCAVEQYRLSAEAGDPEAQYLLASLYAEGRGVKKDIPKAIEWFTKAAASGVPEAHQWLGYTYHYGVGVPKDQKLANKHLRSASAGGLVEPESLLGEIYSQLPQQVNIENALKWHRLAAEHGNVPSMMYMGYASAKGRGTPIDLKESSEWYLLASEGGSARAGFIISQFHYYGIALPESKDLALELAKVAAANGSVDAMSFLGHVFYEESMKQEPNSEGFLELTIESYCYHLDAALEGDQGSIKFLAGFFERNGFGLNYALAARMEPRVRAKELIPARDPEKIKEGDTGPKNLLEDLDLDGEDSRICLKYIPNYKTITRKRSDEEKSPLIARMKRFRQAIPSKKIPVTKKAPSKKAPTKKAPSKAPQKPPFPNFFQDSKRLLTEEERDWLAPRLRELSGEVPSLSTSESHLWEDGDFFLEHDFYWYKLAAEKGHAESLLRLGVAHETGVVLPFDRTLAYSYFQRASLEGSDYASVILEYYYRLGLEPSERPLTSSDIPCFDNFQGKDALVKLKELAEEKDSLVIYALGLMYYLGIGTEVNYTKAEEFFLRASERGSGKADFELYRIYLSQGEKTKAKAQLEEAAESGYLRALLETAYAYKYGSLHPINQIRANMYFLKAANRNERDAVYEWANINNFGLKTKVDKPLALELYSKAMSLGHPLAGYIFLHERYQGLTYDKVPDQVEVPKYTPRPKLDS